MTAIEYNHVTIHAEDLEESVAFYEDVFGLERVQAPNLGNPLAWMQVGERQLHIVERETEPPRYHHFALTVDDFERVFDLARERSLFDEEGETTSDPYAYELPDGAVQMYVRDPVGNLIEVNWPDVTTLSDDVREHVVDRSEQYEQSEAQAQARLFLADIDS